MQKTHRSISRRRFLKNTGSLAAAASLSAWVMGGCATPGGQKLATLSPNDKIQVGLIGCGGRGKGDAPQPSPT